jgi:SAM-dependent methyltransferase
MILMGVIRDLFRRRDATTDLAVSDSHGSAIGTGGPSVLNVGGGSKQIPIPGHYSGWTHLLLDIDAGGNPDVICDARKLSTLQGEQFNAVYCSHNLEHYYMHDALKVLRGFLHVLKPDGFAEIRVPDLSSVMKRVVAAGLDVEDTLYVSPSGPISVRDVIYGFGKQIEISGVDFYAHKTGFTPASLRAALIQSGFPHVFVFESEDAFEVRAVAFKSEPAERLRAMLHL